MSFYDEKFPEPETLRPARRIVISCPTRPELEPVVIDVDAFQLPPGWLAGLNNDAKDGT